LSKDFNVIIHKVHKELDHGYPAPLNACETCHTGGTPTEAFPLVANPNPISVCDGSRYGVANLTWGEIGPLEIRIGDENGIPYVKSNEAGSKTTGKWVADGLDFTILDRDTGESLQSVEVETTVFGCVGNAPHTFRGIAGAQHTNWLDHPSRKVCGSCHTDVNFATGEGHSELQLSMVDDELCAICHIPDSGVETGEAWPGHHNSRVFCSSLLVSKTQIPVISRPLLIH
jgi:hypothetical protein